MFPIVCPKPPTQAKRVGTLIPRQSSGPMTPGGNVPHHPMPMSQAQIQQQQHAQAAANELAKRRSRKPTDKSMPDGVESVAVGDGVQRYKDLRDFERRLDATMTRKRLDIVDSVNRNPKVCLARLPEGMNEHTVRTRSWSGLTLPSPAFQNPADMDHEHGRGPDLAGQRPHRGQLRLLVEHGVVVPGQDRGPPAG